MGIPARLVSGAQYTRVMGGSFGQHVWTEVYMGEQAGWVPVDSTLGEPDYIDAGHLRLGPATNGFNPKSVRVLEHGVAAE